MSDSENDSSDYDSSNYDSSNSSDRSYSDSVDELCVGCEAKPPSPHLQLEDGYYCEDCYESQKSS
jgi:hypothetical protein